MKLNRASSAIMLLTASLIWGFSFVAMKGLTAQLPVNFLLAARFFVGALGLVFFVFKFAKSITKKTVLRGMALGAALYAAFAFQTYGLKYSFVGENALITAIYVVLVPIFMWVVDKARPKARTLLAAVVCMGGIALLSMFSNPNDAELGSLSVLGTALEGTSLRMFANALTLISGVLFALHIVLAKIFTRSDETMSLTCFQFAFAAAFALVAALIFEPMPTGISSDAMLPLAYVCILSTLVALTLQNLGLKGADASVASVLLCTESLFGCIGGIIFNNESFTLYTAIGAALVIAAVLISELGGSARKRG